MNDATTDRNPVDLLAEEFVARHRRGERPRAQEYAERYPELAEQILALFPAMLMLEDLRPESAEPGAAQDDLTAAGVPLEQLGDYRLLREVGRGGMGIVYEAEQESLGRHVAV
jgi:serine/threonine protein kinase